ncbi:MAG TPA: DUF6798 domain-containing protein, partial [Candidatus Bathyarchaeia archaeon]|nr:DUF6798 domain-containing protein [Candidatus Bathyarchaeia archaeon]
LFFLLSLIVLLSNREKLFNKKRFFEPLFFGVFFFFLVFASLWRMGKNYQNWGRLTLNNSLEKDWQELQLWVRGNTSSDALFITPPQLTGFRVSSQRSIIGEYKDGANFIYHPDLLSEWWKRMEDLGVEKEMVRGAFLFEYQEINEEEKIKNLTQKYNANHLISSYHDLPFPKIYNNTKFSVYRLN